MLNVTIEATPPDEKYMQISWSKNGSVLHEINLLHYSSQKLWIDNQTLKSYATFEINNVREHNAGLYVLHVSVLNMTFANICKTLTVSDCESKSDY